MKTKQGIQVVLGHTRSLQEIGSDFNFYYLGAYGVVFRVLGIGFRVYNLGFRI